MKDPSLPAVKQLKGAAYGSPHHKTLVHALKHNSAHSPDHVLIEWVNNQCKVESSITYQGLWHQSGLVATLLLQNGVKRGDRVMIAYPFGLEFLSGLFGCMRIGVIPCSVYPPNFVDKSKARFSFEQFNNQVEDAGAKFALTNTLFKRGLFVAALSGHKTGCTKWLATDKLKKSPTTKELEDFQVSSKDTAFIQYSSGSTGSPKGIVISHGAVVHNLAALQVFIRDRGSNRLACWLPQYHDYGLVVNYLTACVYPNYFISAFSPIDFIRNPLLWADVIEKFDSTATAAPNFAYALLAKRMKAAGRKFGSNSSLTQVNISAEPIALSTLTELEEIGISRDKHNPTYGLAEVCVAGTDNMGDEVTIHEGVVSCGLLERSESLGKYIRVAAENGSILSDGEVGQIYIRGPDLASGYWNKPELTKQFHCKLSDGKEYFATGDLGHIVEGRLYVVGRSKELIIINGKNLYPQDIERVIEAEYPDVVRPGSTVAFQYTEDDIGIGLEIRKTVKSLDDISEVFSEQTIRRLVSDSCGVKIGNLKMHKQGSIPKTTSGKLKRTETRRLALEGGWSADKILYDSTTKSTSPTVECHAQTCDNVEVEASIKFVVGQDIDMESDWETNGLTSLMHAELSSRVQDVHLVTLPINFQQTCPTPSQLKFFIEKSASQLFPIKLASLGSTREWKDSCKSLPLPVLGILQAIGVLLLLLVVVACLVPTYYMGKYAVQLSTTFEIGVSGRYATLSWLPVAVPIFFVTFSGVVVLLKWVVIGQYHSGTVDLPSVSYLRWWFMDRLMDLWERWVGGFIVDTKMIWIFYRLLGARLAWSCNVKSFIREFDLVEVGSNSLIEHQIRCRKFLPWVDDGAPSLVFRAITIGDDCTVKGMLGPGVNLGGSSRVEVFSALPEGSQVAEGTLVKGSPAFNAGSYDGVEGKRGYWLVEMLKVGWLLVEVYLFFSLLLLSQMCLNQQLPNDWRYTPLMYWILMLLLTSMFGVLVSIALKWILIGRRRPEEGDSNPWRRVCRWCCDYHYSVATMTLVPLLGMSRVWNIILILHGLDVDLISKPGASLATFRPSKVDLIRIRRSFMSNLLIDSDSDYVEIVDSSLGFNVHIGPGVKIIRSVIPPRAVVNESVYDTNSDENDQRSHHSTASQVLMELSPIVTALLICASFIPSYELFVATVMNAAPGVAILWLLVILLVQSMTWIFVECLAQLVLYASNAPAYLFVVYSSYLIVAWHNHDWNILVTSLRGTYFIRYYLWFMGSRVEGQLWYFGSDIYDYPKLSFEDKTIIDDAHIAGHHVVFGNVVLDDTRVGGVVHPGTYCPAGSKLEGTESGPWKVYLGGRGEKGGAVTNDSMLPINEESNHSYAA